MARTRNAIESANNNRVGLLALHKVDQFLISTALTDMLLFDLLPAHRADRYLLLLVFLVEETRDAHATHGMAAPMQIEWNPIRFKVKWWLD